MNISFDQMTCIEEYEVSSQGGIWQDNLNL
jgi:hypothetical protein